mgnify:CR=1 FL=1
MKRTVLALLLAVFMAATLMTVGAAAEGNEAAIGDTEYDTLTEALSKAQSGDTVRLLKDIDNSITAVGYKGGINYSLNEGVTLDGADHTISGHIGVRINAAGGTVKNVKFKNIHNDVEVDADTCEHYGWESKTGNQSAIYASGLTGKAVITGCTFDNIDWDAIQITPTKTAEIEITDNVFKHTNTTDTQLRYVHIQYTAGSFGVPISELIITDNQFYTTENTDDFFCSIGIWNVNKNTPILQLNGNYVEDYSTTEVSVIGLGYLFPARSTPDAMTDDYQPVAYNGTEIYMTLKEAAEKSDSYIKMMADAADQTATIPAGKTISFYSYGHDIGTLTNNGELTVYGSDLAKSSSKIINNGALSLSGNSATVYEVENNGALYVTSGATYDLGKITGSGSVTITGGTFSTKPTADWLAPWYKAAESGDPVVYKVSKMTIAEGVAAGMVATSARSSGDYYTSVAEGLNSTTKAQTHLQVDSAEDAVIYTPYDGGRSLYSNKHSFTGSIVIEDNCDFLNLLGSDFNLKYVEGDRLRIGFYSTPADVAIQDADLDQLEISASGVCTVEGGYYDDVVVHEYYANASATAPEYSAELVINGGSFGSNVVTLKNANHTPATKTLPIKDFLAPGLVYELNNGGVYSYYKTVDEALAEAEPGAVISYIGDDAPTTYYKVTIVYGNGMSEEVKDIAKDSVLVLPAAPSKNGYIFMGWKCSDGHTHEAGETVVVNSDLTFTAVWSALPDIEPGEPSGPDEPVEPSALPFVDVSVNAWYYESVKAAYEAGLMNGVTDTEFAPNATLTRAMIWTIIARASGVETEGGATWYAKAQEWVVANGVSDGEDPMGNVTREQLVTMLWRLNGSEVMTGYIGNYIDTGDISEWANNAMLWAVQNGIIEGDENMALAPKADTTRAQAATFFVRYLTVA